MGDSFIISRLSLIKKLELSLLGRISYLMRSLEFGSVVINLATSSPEFTVELKVFVDK